MNRLIDLIHMKRLADRNVCLTKRMPHSWLTLLALLAVALLGLGSLSACSSSPTSAVAVPTATSGDIQITVDRTHYDTHTPVGVTVTNTSSNTYYALTGRSGCTFLQMQEYDTSKKTWVNVFGCATPNPIPLKISSKLSEPFTLAPNSPNDPNSWDPGLYRVALAYGTQADGSNANLYAYSPGFQIS